MKERNKILIVIPSLTLGGAEKQALEYAKSLKRIGFYPIVLGLGRDGEMVSLLKRFEIDYRSYSFTSFFKSNKFKQLFFLIKFVFFIRKLHCKKGISFTYWPNVIFKLIYSFSGIKSMYWNQRSVDEKLQPVFWERISSRIKINYLANSLTSAESISRRHQISEHKIGVIYNVMPITEIIERNRKPNELNLVMVANFFPEKDHETLLKAFKVIIDSGVHNNIYMHLVGSAPGISPRMNEMKALAFDLNLYEKVIFHDVVENVKDLLLNTDIGILSTISEGFSNAIMEYMEAGLPVVASDIRPNKEALGNENSKFFFRVGDELSLAKTLNILIEDVKLRIDVGQFNRERALRLFHQSSLDKALQDLIN